MTLTRTARTAPQPQSPPSIMSKFAGFRKNRRNPVASTAASHGAAATSWINDHRIPMSQGVTTAFIIASLNLPEESQSVTNPKVVVARGRHVHDRGSLNVTCHPSPDLYQECVYLVLLALG